MELQRHEKMQEAKRLLLRFIEILTLHREEWDRIRQSPVLNEKPAVTRARDARVNPV